MKTFWRFLCCTSVLFYAAYAAWYALEGIGFRIPDVIRPHPFSIACAFGLAAWVMKGAMEKAMRQ